MTARSQSRTKAGQPPETEEPFPPLSTSLEVFVREGSDRSLRRLVYSLFHLASVMTQNRERFATYIGMTGPQYVMTTLIAEDTGATVSKLADQLGVSSQFVTIEIAKLVKSGVVEKKPNPADRRSMILRLTDKGRRLLREVAPIRRRANDLTFKSLTSDRAVVLQDILNMLIVDSETALHELEAPGMRGRTAPSLQAEAGAVGKRSVERVGGRNAGSMTRQGA